MAADRQRLAAALAYEEERRRRMMESVPMTDNLPPVRPARSDLRTNLENFSAGLGQAGVNALEGTKALITDPVGTVKGTYESVRQMVRDPSLIADALRYTADKAMSGPLGAGEMIGEMVNPMRMRGKGPIAEIDVYHGSPHRFEEFDASKIGTGEGAQAYGHGIYLAEKPSTAEIYRRALAEDVISVDGRRIAAKRTPEARNDPETIAVDAIVSAHGGQFEDPFSKAIERLGGKYGPRNENYAKAMELAREWRGKGAKVEVGGNLYTADLPDEMVDRMLDWDKPLSEQPKAVRQALKSAGLTQYVDEMEASYLGSLPPQAQALALKMINGSDEMVIAQGKGFKGNDIAARNWAQLERLAPGIDHNQIHDIRDWYASKNGADLYAEMSQGAGGRSAVTASDRLRQMGIPGIRYLDAGSRGQGGSGTRNFVVFPGEEKKVKILRRE